MSAAAEEVHSRVNESRTVVGEGVEDCSSFTKTETAVWSAKRRHCVDGIALPYEGDGDPASLKGWRELEVRIDSRLLMPDGREVGCIGVRSLVMNN